MNPASGWRNYFGSGTPEAGVRHLSELIADQSGDDEGRLLVWQRGLTSVRWQRCRCVIGCMPFDAVPTEERFRRWMV